MHRSIVAQLPKVAEDEDPISMVRVRYKKMQPWLDLQLCNGKPSGAVSIDAGRKRSGLSTQTVVLCVSAAFCYVLALSIASLQGAYARSSWWLVLFAALGMTFVSARAIRQVSMTKTYDTIVLAHPLRWWQRTGISKDVSREEAARRLLPDEADEALRAALELGTTAAEWTVLQGTQAGDWLQENDRFIRYALQRRLNGDLSELVEGGGGTG